MPPVPENEKVAVIIAAYNAATTIARAVQSALAQPEVAEVIVVDDASGDYTATAARVQDDKSGRLIVLSQPHNAGPSAARNRAIQQSTSPWIAMLDADDFFLPGRIKGLLAFKENADLIADNLWQVPENNIDGPRRSMLRETLAGPKEIDFNAFVLSNVTKGGRKRSELGFIKPLMRRSFLETNHLCYRETMRLGEDFELYAKALAMGARLLLVPAQGYISVWRKNSLSGRHSEVDLLHLRDCNMTLAQELTLSADQKNALRKHYLSVDCRLQWRLLILAVKRRNPLAILKTFLRPLPVPFYLMKKLAEQLYLRVFHLVKSEQ